MILCRCSCSHNKGSDEYISYLSESLFRLWLAFAYISHASSGPNPPRSCDRRDDDHMTAVVHRRWGELVPLFAVHDRLSYFNFDACESLQPSETMTLKGTGM